MQCASSTAKNAGRARASASVKPGAGQALGRDVEQHDAAGGELAVDRGALLAALAAVEVGGGDALLAQPVDLVLHERDERRDDDGETAEVHGRRLVAERFAAARGEHHEAVAALEHRVHRVFLQRTEATVAPHAPQRLVDRDHGAILVGVRSGGNVQRSGRVI